MQYRTGTVTVQLASNLVTGAGTAWLGQINPGDMLWVGPDSVASPTAFVAAVLSNTQLRLENGWPGVSQADAVYAIHRDFDPSTRAPLMARGETRVVETFNRAVAALSVQTAVATAASEAVTQARAARDEAEDARDIAVDAAADAASIAATLHVITVSTAPPTGGAVGAIWFQVSS